MGVKIVQVDLDRRSYLDARGRRQLRLARIGELAGRSVDDVQLPEGWTLAGQRIEDGWLWLELAPVVAMP